MGGRLLDRFGESAILELGEGRFLRVIRDGHWSFPPASTNDLVDIFHLIRDGDPPYVEHDDEVIWSSSSSGEFSIASSFSDQQSIPVVSWSDLLWFKSWINKHSIYAWMVLHNGLKTRFFWHLEST